MDARDRRVRSSAAVRVLRVEDGRLRVALGGWAPLCIAVSPQITRTLFDYYSMREKTGLASIRSCFPSFPLFLAFDFFWSGLEYGPMILSVGGLASDCPLCKSDFACDRYDFLVAGFPQLRPFHRLLSCYRFLFAAIFDISRFLHFFWVCVFVVHRYEDEVNLSQVVNFSL
jgi:hypothetical protein